MNHAFPCGTLPPDCVGTPRALHAAPGERLATPGLLDPDRSRRRREWCAMRTCGNRLKAAVRLMRRQPGAHGA